MSAYVRTEINPRTRFRLTRDAVFARIDDAYTAVREALGEDADDFVAWKLGGTTAGTRSTFGVDSLYFGPLHRSEVQVSPREAPALPLCEMKGEIEVAVRIGGEDLDAWCVALEMPASPIENLLEVGVAALVADRCAAGGLILGQPRSIGALHGRGIALEQDGHVVARGSIASLVAPPIDCARDFLREARARGFAPRAGQWISTGGLTPCVPLMTGSRVRVLWDGEPGLELRIREANP